MYLDSKLLFEADEENSEQINFPEYIQQTFDKIAEIVPDDLESDVYNKSEADWTGKEYEEFKQLVRKLVDYVLPKTQGKEEYKDLRELLLKDDSTIEGDPYKKFVALQGLKDDAENKEKEAESNEPTEDELKQIPQEIDQGIQNNETMTDELANTDVTPETLMDRYEKFKAQVMAQAKIAAKYLDDKDEVEMMKKLTGKKNGIGHFEDIYIDVPKFKKKLNSNDLLMTMWWINKLFFVRKYALKLESFNTNDLNLIFEKQGSEKKTVEELLADVDALLPDINDAEKARKSYAGSADQVNNLIATIKNNAYEIVLPFKEKLKQDENASKNLDSNFIKAIDGVNKESDSYLLLCLAEIVNNLNKKSEESNDETSAEKQEESWIGASTFMKEIYKYIRG